MLELIRPKSQCVGDTRARLRQAAAEPGENTDFAETFNHAQTIWNFAGDGSGLRHYAHHVGLRRGQFHAGTVGSWFLIL